MIEMKTLTIGGNTYEVVDDTARTEIDSLSTNIADETAAREAAVNELKEANATQDERITALEQNSGTDSVAGTFIDYDANVKAVAHRGYSTTAPENTIPAYIMAAKQGFKYVECDVCFTADGVAVLLHDGNIDRTSDGSGNIGSMTYAQALQYDFGSWKSSDYAGTKIPTFSEFMGYCRGLGLHPYIELKTGTQVQITKIVDTVKAYGMTDNATYISFSSDLLRYVKEADVAARLGYLTDVTNGGIETAVGLKTERNEVFIDTSYGTVTGDKIALCVANDLPLEVYTVNSQGYIQSMNPYISGVTSDSLIAGKILYSKHMTYTAPETPDDGDGGEESVPATSVVLNETELTFNDTTTKMLIATVKPDNTTDTVIWTTSASDVAVVDGGLVTPISDGSATITATAGSVSATCFVTVDMPGVVTYTISRNLAGCSSSSALTSIKENVEHSETLIAKTGYTMNEATVTVIMAGNDITSAVYSDGKISIAKVTGDIVITAEAKATSEGDYNDSSLWKTGFISTEGLVNNMSGATTSGEMYYDKYIPVTPGEYVYLVNTNDETSWVSSWTGVGFYSEENEESFVSRTTIGSGGKENYTAAKILNYFPLFKVPDNAHYALVSTRNASTDNNYMDLMITTNYPSEYLDIKYSTDLWTNGYLSGTGDANTNSSQGEMRLSRAVKVESGKTYRFANGNSEWSSSWVAYIFVSNEYELGTRQTITTGGNKFDIAVPEGQGWMILTSRNMTNYYQTATLTEVVN